MATLVFDIETAPRAWDTFDSETQVYLTRSIGSQLSDAEYAEKLRELQGTFGLSPFTGQIITVGVYDMERRQGVVYYVGDDVPWEEGDFAYRPCPEDTLLREFWEGARSYDVFVTFAGRTFDAPFLNIRSAAHGITPTKELLQHRYLNRQIGVYHVDLQDQLSYYGALGRRPSLHMSTKVFGIASSKTAGVGGGDVAALFVQKQYRKIATYNACDVMATARLYERWYDHLAPSTFRNAIEI